MDRSQDGWIIHIASTLRRGRVIGSSKNGEAIIESMIDPETGTVNRSRIRISADERRDSISKVCSVGAGQGESIQDLLKCAGYTLSNRHGRDIISLRSEGRLNPQPLIRVEEERLVLPVVNFRHKQSPTERSAKVVLMHARTGHTVIIVEPVVRVHRTVAQIIERAAMPLVGARARVEGELPAWRASIFSGVSGSRSPELLQRINRDQALCGAQCSFRRRRAREACTPHRRAAVAIRLPYVRAHAINEEIIRLGPLAIYRNLTALSLAEW